MESLLSSSSSSLPFSVRSLALPLVLLSAYRCGAHCSLSTWVAVSSLPCAPAPETEHDARRLKRARILRAGLVVLGCLALYGTELGVLLASDGEKLANAFFGVLAGTILTAAYFSALAYGLSLPRAAWNHESGRLIVRLHCPTRAAKVRAGAVALASVGLATATVLLPNSGPLNLAATFALVFALVSKPASRITGVRRLTIFFCAYEAAVIALTIALVWFAPQNEKPTSFIGENGDREDISPEDLAKMMPSGLMAFLSQIIPALYAAPVGYYIAACLRYDWHASRSSSEIESASVLALEQIAPRTGCACARRRSGSSTGRPATSSGLRIPTDTQFCPAGAAAKKYFTTTTLVATILLCTMSPALDYVFQEYVFPLAAAGKGALAQQYFESQTFGMLSMFLTIPIMCIAIAVQAASTGDRKQLWSYREIWHGKGAGRQPVALAAGDDADAESKAEWMEKPKIVIEDVDAEIAGEQTPLISLEEAIKS